MKINIVALFDFKNLYYIFSKSALTYNSVVNGPQVYFPKDDFRTNQKAAF